MKASANFNASADAEVLYKAMKGLGEMFVCPLGVIGYTSVCSTMSCSDPVVCVELKLETA